MPVRELEEQLTALRDQLDQEPPLSLEERDKLEQLMQQIGARIKVEDATQQPDSLSDGLTLAVERLEVEYPKVASVLRDIVQKLGSMGV
ncbi:DUF4404 family protein [Pseudomonas typographi]|uniref:DUF4404 family protein n=1 Tax=Pseudomonas typographi TaxID=2715964 RepID=UPI0016842DCD|nr:DUF4404 family protein [Pseudomonas typographi]MBD1554243.1 DUF4404 family protein [Pseudomonas typographi]MBD1586652.1 DUF4404 family protein [Pseudomonas typographi]